MSGFKTYSGEEISTLITKGASPRWQGFEYNPDGETLFVTSENVRDGNLDISEPKFLPREFNDSHTRSQLKTNDILINIVGASIGRSCLYAEKNVTANINQAVCLLRPSELVDPKYVAYFLQLPSSVRTLIGDTSTGAQPNLSLADIRRMKFLLPELWEQKAIVEILSDCDAAIEKHERLGHLHQMKAAYELENIHAMLVGLHDAESSNIGDLVISHSLRGHQLDRKNYGQRGKVPIIDQSEELICGYTDDVSLAIENDSGSVIFGDHTRVVKLYRGPFVAGADGTKVLSPKDQTVPTEYLKFLVSKAAKSIPDLGYSRHFSELRRVSVSVLSGEARQKFVCFYNEVERQKSVYNELAYQLGQRKRGLMQQLLSGQMRVKGAA